MVACMDDVAIPILRKGTSITRLATTAIETAAEVFGRIQFKPKYKLGKTNVILRPTDLTNFQSILTCNLSDTI